MFVPFKDGFLAKPTRNDFPTSEYSLLVLLQNDEKERERKEEEERKKKKEKHSYSYESFFLRVISSRSKRVKDRWKEGKDWWNVSAVSKVEVPLSRVGNRTPTRTGSS